MTRFRIALAIVIVLACGLVFAAIVVVKRSNYRWQTTSPPPPDTLTGISRLTIAPISEKWSFEVTDPSEIASFAEFIHRGTYERLDKMAYDYLIRVEYRNGEATYYNHCYGIGPKPGGFIQIIFVPAEPGFQSWFEGLLRQYGHERKKNPPN
jgi:hypothetical protein